MKTLADRFEYLGDLFIKFSSKDNILDMDRPCITVCPLSPCKTVACHGGWAWLFHLFGILPIPDSVSKGLKADIERETNEREEGSLTVLGRYTYGSKVIDTFLFGENSNTFLFEWMFRNKEIWGEGCDQDPFSYLSAFREGVWKSEESNSLKKIGKKYKAVAKRLRKVKK